MHVFFSSATVTVKMAMFTAAPVANSVIRFLRKLHCIFSFIYRISSFKRRGVYLISGLLGAAYIRGRRLKEEVRYSCDVFEVAFNKGPVKLIKRVKIPHSFLQFVSNQFHVIILSLPT